ncbi:Similar to Hat1: Histone acetyltransferase type B catalytic subunit (Mus musculus) [Cotesia congregata]|uniref:Histone acetyltransferase type B catalytic subunit n=1 Tax=Cotesia congregata TaxID=51543 RepID=A0A8J2HI22_COTCN|nr:Similar to Hat1: Histone acetyltransferase type B catalytic subunit (Mus musculus) [Cotesia congregata]
MDDTTTARLQGYVVDSNEVLEFKLVRDERDLEDAETSFAPEMSHQVFGDSETIFGYKDLKIKLYYSAGSLETYLGMSYSEKLPKGMFEGVEADDVLPKIKDKLVSQSNFQYYVIEIFYYLDEQEKTRNFEVYKADMTCKGFKEYHQRLQTFLLWYIDAASFIDIDDDQWHYFNMFEKFTSTSGSVRYSTVGFATVYQYYAYPNHTRPRIAQILVLPPFQGLGLGANLLRAMYRQYIGDNQVKDITVEDPSPDFQRVRDYVDALNCATLPAFGREFLQSKFNKAMALEAREKFKINKRQARRIYEILRLKVTDLSNEKEYRDYRLEVKKRLNVPYKRERRDLKKLESVVKSLDKKETNNVILLPNEQRIQALEKEYRALEEEYKKVIKHNLDAWKKLPAFCVGPSTEACAKECLELNLCEGSHSGNARELAEYIVNKFKKNIKPLLYPCSEISRDTILKVLTANDIKFEKLNVYKTLPADSLGKDLSKIVSNRPQIFVFFSPSVVEFLVNAAKEKSLSLDKIKSVAIGPVTAEALVKAELSVTGTAAKPNPHVIN